MLTGKPAGSVDQMPGRSIPPVPAQPLLPGVPDQLRVVGRRGHGAVTHLGVVQPFARDRREVRERRRGPRDVQGVTRTLRAGPSACATISTAAFASGTAVHGMNSRLATMPYRAHSSASRAYESVSGAVGVVAADEHGLGPSRAPALEQRHVRRRVEIRSEPDDLEVEHLDRRVREATLEFDERALVLVQRVGRRAGGGRRRRSPDRVEPVALGEPHVVERRGCRARSVPPVRAVRWSSVFSRRRGEAASGQEAEGHAGPG